MGRYCKMPKHQTGRLGSFEGGLGFSLAMPSLTAVAAPAILVANTANWAAQPVGTHSSWAAQLPGAMIANGHRLDQRTSDRKVAIIAGTAAVTPYMTVEELKSGGSPAGIHKNNSGKIVFACCGYNPSAVSPSPTPSSPQNTPAPASSGTDWSSALTGISSIIGAIGAPAVGIFAAQQQAKLERDRLRAGGGGGTMDPAMMAMMMQNQQGGLGAGAIIAIVIVAVLVLGGMAMMMKSSTPKTRKRAKKKSKRK